ncbi:Molecular chaperone IbpA, HSP20 family [Halobacillus dabanensis]|uniref:Molecular chaperone IbpA, HSP20 family n=1 Tax=Halobacillus dabanensis TaxID=240302 RepID=A0A1I3VHG0_HALDA|nr:Hsp20/alpha crystallin family protein [Halobacillus dabanensis]SFJ94705.1 Molecular chaperone IbpA, HSP20 family [Halobacillus dabanensis]
MNEKHDQLPDLFDQRFKDMVRAVDSFFDESIKHVSQFFQQATIPVEVFETDQDVTVEAYLPNIRKDQIRIDRAGNQLRIRVEDSYMKEVKDEDVSYYNRSESFSQRERIISIPFGVADTASSASFKGDILRIVFPKSDSTIKVIDVDQ